MQHPCHERRFETEFLPSQVEEDVVAWWDRERPAQDRARRARAGGGAENRKNFSMVLPPPNVTGQLHLGHALTVTIQDALVRFHRMRGDDVTWIPGVDHAGIATQSVVERRLLKSGIGSRHDLGREEFLGHVWKWCEQYSGRIDSQLKRLGASLDWDRRRFTLDDVSSSAVNHAFVELHSRGLVFRKTRLVNWCPYLCTAISDLEMEHEELAGSTMIKLPQGGTVECGVMHDFAYQVIGDDSQEIVVSTTRLETMLGDTGVAVHPDDPRYVDLVGKQLRHPLFPERTLPVVADAELGIDMALGTGAVKLTPAHSDKDYECGIRHKLEIMNIMNDDGTLNEACGPKWAGKDRFDVRRELAQVLEQLGLCRGKRNHAMTLGRCSRSGDIIEPLLKPQWFVDCSKMADRALGYAFALIRSSRAGSPRTATAPLRSYLQKQ